MKWENFFSSEKVKREKSEERIFSTVKFGFSLFQFVPKRKILEVPFLRQVKKKDKQKIVELRWWNRRNLKNSVSYRDKIRFFFFTQRITLKFVDRRSTIVFISELFPLNLVDELSDLTSRKDRVVNFPFQENYFYVSSNHGESFNDAQRNSNSNKFRRVRFDEKNYFFSLKYLSFQREQIRSEDKEEKRREKPAADDELQFWHRAIICVWLCSLNEFRFR